MSIQPTIAANLWAQANRQKLLQVVLNLLSNALKYGPANSEVKLNAYQRQRHIIIEVEDRGAGIAPELKARLFTPFDRLGAEHTKIEGTGLGLALSRQIMETMHGSIHVADDKSLFWIEIPACQPDMVGDTATQTAAPRHENTLGKKHTILYVEDNASNRALVEAIIQRQRDLRIHSVTTLKEARRYLQEVTPSLMIIDLDLPDGSGETLITEMQSSTTHARIPTMVLSADALPETMARLERIGANHYMTKPLDVMRFNKTIRELISH